jgi:hypothetical protein
MTAESQFTMMPKVHIKVWTSDLKECEQFEFLQCPSRPKAEIVKRFVADLEKRFPGNTFRTVPIGQHRYNVIPDNPKEPFDMVSDPACA